MVTWRRPFARGSRPHYRPSRLDGIAEALEEAGEIVPVLREQIAAGREDDHRRRDRGPADSAEFHRVASKFDAPLALFSPSRKYGNFSAN
jgi:hypothetical protein